LIVAGGVARCRVIEDRRRAAETRSSEDYLDLLTRGQNDAALLADALQLLTALEQAHGCTSGSQKASRNFAAKGGIQPSKLSRRSYKSIIWWASPIIHQPPVPLES